MQADQNLNGHYISHFEILLSNRSFYYFGPLSPEIVGPFLIFKVDHLTLLLRYNMKNLKIKVLALLRKHMINKTLPQINR